MRILIGLRRQDRNADLFLEDSSGSVLASSTESGTTNESIGVTLQAGTYYIRAEAAEVGQNVLRLRYGVEAAEVGVGEGEPDLPGWDVAGSAMLTDTGELLSEEQLASVTRTLSGPETHVINHPGDVDWFKVNMEADSLYAIKVIGRDTYNNTGFTVPHPTIKGEPQVARRLSYTSIGIWRLTRNG